MILDQMDLQILKAFSTLKVNEEKDLSTWMAMKRIYPVGKERENEIIKNRIKKMSKFGLFKITKNSPTKYGLVSDKVYYRNFSFPEKRSKAIAINIDNKWEVFEL